jgi:hypothetical protein
LLNLILKGKTTQMEVHHQHHLPKNIREYLIEFLMLFLAVTLGFFAENLREHYVEREREDQFIEIVDEDIQTDIRNLQAMIRFTLQRKAYEDSLIDILSGDAPYKTHDLYYYARVISLRNFFYHSDNGFQQLRNAGGLRMIKDLQVIRKIQSYQNKVIRLDEMQKLMEQILSGYRDRAAVLFSGKVFKRMFVDPGSKDIYKRFQKPEGDPELMTADRAVINEFLVKAIYVNSNSTSLLINLTELLNEAEGLHQLLAAAYHLGEQKAS